MAPPSEWLLGKRVEVRRDDEGAFDELVVYEGGECRLHLEMMDDNHLWMGIYPKGSTDRVTVRVHARGRLSIIAKED